MSAPIRSGRDRCPGLLTPARATDGELVRVRVPGGTVRARALTALAACAREFGDGSVQLTARGNIQLRGFGPGDTRRAAEVLSAAGLHPSASHERARNVLASPLSGLRGGSADVRGLAATLDRLLCSRPALAELPGRFLFALDDGRGDVAGERPDLCWRADGPETGRVLVAGVDAGVEVARADAPSVLVSAAEAFLELRAAEGSKAWRVAELPSARSALAIRIAELPAAEVSTADHPPSAGARQSAAELLGPLGEGVDGIAPAFGELSSAALTLIAGLADEVVVTPWRTILLLGARRGALRCIAAAGLVVDPTDPTVMVSTCAGRPGCAAALADVRGDARAALSAGAFRADERVHVVGCERGCGAPRSRHVRMTAVTDGYVLPDGSHGARIEDVLAARDG